jgi:hypothetical protein
MAHDISSRLPVVQQNQSSFRDVPVAIMSDPATTIIPTGFAAQDWATGGDTGLLAGFLHRVNGQNRGAADQGLALDLASDRINGLIGHRRCGLGGGGLDG